MQSLAEFDQSDSTRLVLTLVVLPPTV